MKRTIALLIVLCTLLSLVACSNAVQTPATTQSNKQTSEQNVPTQHVHSFGDWTITKNATCTEAGEQERYCSCGEKQTQTIPATGHSFGSWVTTKEPTCTEAGEQERTCACGEKQTQSVAAKGHSFGDWTTTKEPTCTEAGEQERTCACGEKQTQSVAAKGHSFGEWVVTKAATCTETGEQERTCACGEKETETIKLKDHIAGEAVTENVIETTCVNDGSYDIVTYCVNCGTELSRNTETTEALGHTDTPVCQHCGMNIRKALIADFKSMIDNSENNMVPIYLDSEKVLYCLRYSSSNEPILMVYSKSGTIATFVELYLDETDDLHYQATLLGSDYLYYIECTTNMKKAELTSSVTGMAYDKTNIPTSLSSGQSTVQNLKTLAASGIKLALLYLDSYLVQNGYPFSHFALGYTEFDM